MVCGFGCVTVWVDVMTMFWMSDIADQAPCGLQAMMAKDDWAMQEMGMGMVVKAPSFN